MNHNAPCTQHRLDEATKNVKAGIGWTGSAVSGADRIHTDGKGCMSTLPQRDKYALG